MTELEFVKALLARPNFSMVTIAHMCDKFSLEKSVVGTIRRNMMNNGYVAGQKHEFTEKLKKWPNENDAASTLLTTESFRAAEGVQSKESDAKGATRRQVDRESFLAKVAELGDTPGRARELAKHFNIPQSHVFKLITKYDVPAASSNWKAKAPVNNSLKEERAKAELMAAQPKPMPLPVAYNNKTAHQDILASLHELYVAKNKDYGDSFHVNYIEFGIMSAVIRMNDKWNRIKSLSKQPAQVVDESIRDTLIDLANYFLMTVMELDRLKDSGNSDLISE